MGQKMHMAMIEGLGDDTAATASDKEYRFCYSREFIGDAATVDPDSLYKEGLSMWPSELSQDWDVTDGRVALGSQTFEFRGTTLLRQLLWTINHVSVDTLNTDISATDTVVILDTDGSLAGTTVYLEREAIKLGSVSGAGPYTYTGCTRGRLGTVAVAHGSDARDDNEVFTTCHILEGRTIRLMEMDLDASAAYGTETRLWTYVIRNVTSPDGGLTLVVETDSLLAGLFQKQIYDEGVFRARIIGAAGVVDGAVSSIHMRPLNPGPNTMLAEILPGGMPASGAGVATDTTEGHFIGLIDDKWAYKVAYRQVTDVVAGVGRRMITTRFGVEEFGRGLRGATVHDLNGKKIREIITAEDLAPSNESSPGNSTLPLSQNPGEAILQILTTTRNDNRTGTNGDFDTGCNVIAGGVRQDHVDDDQILAWADELGDAFEQKSYYIGLEDKPLTVGDAVASIAAAFQSGMVQLSNGKIGIARFKDMVKYGSAVAVDEDNILNIGDLGQDRRLYDALDRVTIEYNGQPGLDPAIINSSDIIKYRRRSTGAGDPLEFTAHGLDNDEQAMALAQRIIQRWHEPIPMAYMETNHLEDHSLGDVVTVTHDFIFSTTGGTLGVSAEVFIITGREQVFGDDEHFFRYTMMDVGAVYARTGYIAPTCNITLWDAGTKTLTVSQNQYTATYGAAPQDPLGTGSDRRDIDAFNAGDFVTITDEFFTDIAGSTGLKIADGGIDRANNQITLTTAPSTAPVNTNKLRVAKYATCNQTQKDDWIFVANSSGQLPTSDTAKSYVF